MLSKHTNNTTVRYWNAWFIPNLWALNCWSFNITEKCFLPWDPWFLPSTIFRKSTGETYRDCTPSAKPHHSTKRLGALKVTGNSHLWVIMIQFHPIFPWAAPKSEALHSSQFAKLLIHIDGWPSSKPGCFSNCRSSFSRNLANFGQLAELWAALSRSANMSQASFRTAPLLLLISTSLDKPVPSSFSHVIRF